MKSGLLLATGALLGGLFIACPGAGAQDCGRDSHPLFHYVDRLEASGPEKAAMLAGMCKEMENPGWLAAPSPADVLYASGVKTSLALIGQGLARTDELDGSPAQREYRARLEAASSTPDTLERIRRVYELAAATSGHYDSESYGRTNFLKGLGLFALTPGRLIESARESGSVGVCREFASLLRWSLMKAGIVSEIKAGRDDRGLGHVWVRVHLPEHSFDLDTTFYQDIFTPLFPRHAGYSAADISGLASQCRRVQACWNSEPGK